MAVVDGIVLEDVPLLFDLGFEDADHLVDSSYSKAEQGEEALRESIEVLVCQI